MGEVLRNGSNGSKTTNIRALPARTGLVAALDVGSSKIACIVGRAESGSLRVLGSAIHESQGIRSGTITNLELAEQSIRNAVAAAEQLADHRVQDVILSVQCGQPKSVNARAERPLAGVLIDDNHLCSLLGDAKRLCREDGYETIQSTATGYIVDSVRGVTDPRGMYCDRLGVFVHGVAMRSGPLKNLRLAVERCHLGISRQLYGAYAAGLATLASDEMALGVTLIDMGAGSTSVAVFMENELVHVESVPLGGFNITADIARMLSAPLAAAERIKTLYGSAIVDIDAGGDMIELPLMGEENERGTKRVKRSLLSKIIQDRVEETLGEVQARLRKSGFDVAAGRRAVLTGGGCQLAGIGDSVTRVLGKQVRIGRAQTLPGLPAATTAPAYATALGLLIAGAASSAETHDPNPRIEARPERRGLLRSLGFG